MFLKEKSEFLYGLILSLSQGKGIPYLTLLLALELNSPVLVSNELKRILAYHDPTGAGPKAGDFLPEEMELKTNSQEEGCDDFPDACIYQGRLAASNGNLKYCFMPVNVNTHLLGYLIVFMDKCDINSLLRASMVSARLAISLALKNAWEKRKEYELYQDEFVRDLLYNNYESKTSVYDKARLWKWEFKPPLVIAVMEIDPAKLKTARALGPDFFNRQAIIYALINGQMILILSFRGLIKAKERKELNKFLAEFLSLLESAGIINACLGVGSSVETVTDLYKSYQEAKSALTMGRLFNKGGIGYFEDVGVLKFIFNQPDRELQDFFRRTLGPLLEYDHVQETDLLLTLQAFFNCHCQASECARRLYIHENTLRNRLKKIEQVCGCNLKHIDQQLNLYIALHIYKLGETNK